MIDVANRRGYAGASVAAVIGRAGISRPTFYEYFTDRDDCFRACIEEIERRLLERVTNALATLPPHQAMAATVRVLADYATAEPAAARFLMGESMAGGRGALDARDRAISQIATALERAQQGATPAEAIPDIEPRVLLGSLWRMVAARLRRRELQVSKLTDDLLAWVASYSRPASQRRWQALTPAPAPGRSPYAQDTPIQQPPPMFPPGRPRLPQQEIAENHRLRILHATAALAQRKGYLATTVTDVTKLARIEGRVFYRHFSDKQEAFVAVHELGFQQVMDVTTKAFFSVDGWPQRSWEAGRALTQMLEDNPLVAYVGFVDAYAAGPAAVQRIEDSHAAFLFFLQEGLMQRPASTPPSRVAMEAVIAAIFEIIYMAARKPGELQLTAMLAQIAHIWLTPFLGVEQADAFIAARMSLAEGE